MSTHSPNPETPDPESSPSKRFKIETLPLPFLTSSKGKAPLEFPDGDDAGDDLQPQSCGICLSEEGRAVRGSIDSCDHFFCFICIIEWSKIESRCPLCRGRFSIIRRVRKDGSVVGERAVHVPVRNQIYDPYGDPTGPYAEAKCSICHGTTDECLLLLCDLCDSASHTYCVGLGATVPEDDWFCPDCALLRAEESNNEAETNHDSCVTTKHIDVAPSTHSSVSVFDIISEPEEPSLAVGRLQKLVSLHPSESSSSTSQSDHVANGCVPGARTLLQCRDVHRHIRTLRENWDSLRRGSLSFSSNSSGKKNLSPNGGVISGNSSKEQESSLSSSLQSRTRDNSSERSCNKSSYNVDRAWKMLDRAMSEHNACKPSSVTSKTPSKSCVTKDSVSCNVGNYASKAIPFKNGDRASCGLNAAKSFGKENGRHTSIRLEKKQSSNTNREVAGTLSKYQNPCSPRDFRPSSSREIQTSVPANVCHERDSFTPEEKQNKTLPRVSNKGSGSASSFSAGSTPGVSDVSITKPQRNTISSSCMSCIVAEAGVAEVDIASKKGKDDEAKSEIQSLVKVNLKLLSRGERLGVDKFKEIARISTHTILAACGMEHRDIARPFPPLQCSHDRTQQPHRCTLMPNSCSSCFCVFVKNVVNSVMSDKLNATGKHAACESSRQRS